MPTDAEVREQETVEQVTRTDSPRMPEFPTKDGNWFRFIRSVRSWRGRNVRVPMWEVMVTQEILPNQPELRGKAVFGGEWCDEKVYVLHKVLKIPSENVRKVSKRAKESILALEDVGIGYYDGGQDCNRKGKRYISSTFRKRLETNENKRCSSLEFSSRKIQSGGIS